MSAQLTVDDKLVDEATRLGGHRSREEAVNAALADYVRYRRQLGILELAGKIDFDPGYDYKAARRKDGCQS